MKKNKIKTILLALVLCSVGTISFAGDNTDTTWVANWGSSMFHSNWVFSSSRKKLDNTPSYSKVVHTSTNIRNRKITCNVAEPTSSGRWEFSYGSGGSINLLKGQSGYIRSNASSYDNVSHAARLTFGFDSNSSAKGLWSPDSI